MNHERRRDCVSEGCWQIRPWLLDARRDLLTQPRHEPVKLEPRLARLLLALAERPDEILTAEVLLASVWRDVVVTPDSVYQAIAQLRRALGDDPQCPALIETLPRTGYRLLVPSHWLVPRRRASDVADAPATTAIGGPRPVAPAHALAGAAATAAVPLPSAMDIIAGAQAPRTGS